MLKNRVGDERSGRQKSAGGDHLDEMEWSRLLDDGSLPADRLGHRDDCAACAGEWRARRLLTHALRGVGPIDLPPGLSTRIRAALAAEAESSLTRKLPGGEVLPRWLTWWGRPAGMSAAALLLALSILLAPRLASRAPELPNDWDWAAGFVTPQDPLASEWDESRLVPVVEAESPSALEEGS